MRTFLSKQDSLHRSSHLLRPSSPHSPATSFLKKELSQIIKEELKTYHLRTKLEAQLHEYRQKEANKQLSKMVFEEKMHSYKERQNSSRKKKYEQFLQKQRLRQEKLRQFMKQKQQQHQDKFTEINQTIENVRERHKHITDQDSNFRLRKLGNITSQDNLQRNKSSRRTLRSSRSTSHRQIIHKINQEKQTSLVTNYLKKIQQSQSRVLLKELENEKRARTSKKSRVKCLVEQRNKHEVDLMLKAQQQLKERMQHFQINHLRIQQQKSSVLLTHSMLNDNNFKNAAKRRELLKNSDSKAESNLSDLRGGKQNLLKGYRSTLDLANDERSRRQNLNKMEKQAYQTNLDCTMKLIYEKLQKIKNMKYGEKLDQRSLCILLSQKLMLDKSDPQYAAMVDFLSNERRAFLQAWVKREQQRSKFDKLKKINKALGKAGM